MGPLKNEWRGERTDSTLHPPAHAQLPSAFSTRAAPLASFAARTRAAFSSCKSLRQPCLRGQPLALAFVSLGAAGAAVAFGASSSKCCRYAPTPAARVVG